jgi:hypothetical protein
MAIKKPKAIDWSSTPEVWRTTDIRSICGVTWERIKAARENGSLPYSDVVPRYLRADVRAWIEPDLGAPWLTIDAAAKLAKLRATVIERVVKADELETANGKVSRADLLEWIGGAK